MADRESDRYNRVLEDWLFASKDAPEQSLATRRALLRSASRLRAVALLIGLVSIVLPMVVLSILQKSQLSLLDFGLVLLGACVACIGGGVSSILAVILVWRPNLSRSSRNPERRKSTRW